MTKKLVKKEPRSRRQKLSNRIKVIVVIVIALGSAAGIYSLTDFHYNNSEPGNPIFYFGNTQDTGSFIYPVHYNNWTGGYRPIYPNYTEQQYIQTFGNLPIEPKNLQGVAYGVYNHILYNLQKIPSNYYEQPEFYPSWNVQRSEQQLNLLINDWPLNHSKSWTPFGFTTYPGISQIGSSPGSTVTFYFWLMPSWFVVTYQGMILSTSFQQHIYGIGRIVGNQSTTYASEFLSVHINCGNTPLLAQAIKQNGLNGPEGIPSGAIFETLLPVFPSFPSDWVIPMSITVRIASDATPGTYAFVLNSSNPSSAIYQSMFAEYGQLYVNSGSTFIQSSQPLFEGIVQVT